MPRGASSQREREYNTLKKTFKRERRYPGREEEVAARIVNKQRAQFTRLDQHGQRTSVAHRRIGIYRLKTTTI